MGRNANTDSYSEYHPKTQEFMKGVEQFLKKKYKKLEPQWQAQLEMLAFNHSVFEECREIIKEEGIYDKNKGEKHPLLAVVKSTQETIEKIGIKEFGLSPSSKVLIDSRVKREKPVEKKEDDTDIIKGLLLTE